MIDKLKTLFFYYLLFYLGSIIFNFCPCDNIFNNWVHEQRLRLSTMMLEAPIDNNFTKKHIKNLANIIKPNESTVTKKQNQKSCEPTSGNDKSISGKHFIVQTIEDAVSGKNPEKCVPSALQKRLGVKPECKPSKSQRYMDKNL